MAYSIREASPAELTKWDEFVLTAINGTLFHLRSFLSYHGNRFAYGEKFLVVCKGEAIIAQLSIFIDSEDLAASPYGGSYGGIVFKAPPSFSCAQEIVNALLIWIKDRRVRRLRLTAPPIFCCKQSLDTFSYALLMAGFRSSVREISSVVELPGAGVDMKASLPSKTRNIIRTAQKNGIDVCHGLSLDEVWPLLETTFNRHESKPTHTREELSYLLSTFPSRLKISLAQQKGINLAGIVEFEINSQVQSSFYFCRSETPSQGLSVLVADALQRATTSGYKFYDFGTSTVNMQPRENVFLFKEGFGAIGYFRETFEWDAKGFYEDSVAAG